MLKKIYDAFKLGEEYAKLEENLFCFGRFTFCYPVNVWEKRVTEIEDRKRRLGTLERIAFEIGDDIFTLGSNPELLKPFQ